MKTRETATARPRGDDPTPTDAAAALDLGPLPSLVGYALRRAQIAVFTDFHRVCDPLGLRPAQYSVLLLLRHNPGVRASRLADALGIQRTNFTTLLAGLEAAGLVGRSTDPHDRRAAALELSPAGAELLAQADRLLAKHEQRFRRRLGAADHARLLDLLARITP